MSNNLCRTRIVEAWCMSVMTLGALSIVLGVDLTIPNAELLLAGCIMPPLVMLLVWRRAVPIARPVGT